MLIKSELQHFRKRLQSKGIYVDIPEPEKFLKNFRSSDLDKMLKLLPDFKKHTIDRFLFLDEKSRPKRLKENQGIWQPEGRKNKVIINFFYIKNIEELEAGLSELAKEIEMAKKIENKTTLTVGEPKIIQKIPKEIGLPLVEPSLPEIVIEEITPQPLLLELGKDLKIYLPNIKGLGIEAESFKDKSSIGIELKRRDGKVLSIWQLVSWPSEICIGEKDYKIEKDSLTLFDEETEIRYPLKKGEKGEIIIDLSLIKSKEVEGFLRATS